MGLFSSSSAKQTTNVADRRLAASEGSIVAAEGSKITLKTTNKTLDARTVKDSLGLARYAIQQATAGAEKVAAGFTDAAAASREREQQLLAAAIAPDAAGGANLLQTVVIIAAIGAGAFVLAGWRR